MMIVKTVFLKRQLIFYVCLCLSFWACSRSPEEKLQQAKEVSTVKIANWNLQVFGLSKAKKTDVMQFYASVMDDYDIVFVQEIRDQSGTAFQNLYAMLPGYQALVSSRAGRSNSKEQYGVLFKEGIQAVLEDFNPDPQDRWERPPIKVTFTTGAYTFVVYNIHADPDDVKNELRALQDVVVDQGNVIVMGDLNADCAYYNPIKETEFDFWHWAIDDQWDTTVSATDCTYDRIILNDDSQKEFLSAGVFKEGITAQVSDHYLVYLVMTTQEQAH